MRASICPVVPITPRVSFLWMIEDAWGCSSKVSPSLWMVDLLGTDRQVGGDHHVEGFQARLMPFIGFFLARFEFTEQGRDRLESNMRVICCEYTGCWRWAYRVNGLNPGSTGSRMRAIPSNP